MVTDDRHETERRALEAAVLEGPGHIAPDLRQRIAERRDVPADLRSLLEKIEHHAYQVTDGDIASLRARYSEDQLFEIVVAASLGSALTRVRAGLRALEDA